MRISDIRVTPIAFTDPPLLNAAGVHESYALRTIVQMFTDDGLVGLGEGHGGKNVLDALEATRPNVVGLDPFNLEILRTTVNQTSAFAILETACLDLMGKAVGRPVCDLLGGKVRDVVPYSAYLFFKLGNDIHPGVEFADLSVGDVRTPETMLEQAKEFVKKFGFHALKLKAGFLSPEMDLETLQLLHDHFGEGYPLRIDPNGVWTLETAIRFSKELDHRRLRIEYLEDLVTGQDAMAKLREHTHFPVATNMCVTQFPHIPTAFKKGSVEVILIDHHAWGGMVACRQLAKICETLGWEVSMHSNSHIGVSMAAMTHLGAAIPNMDYACDSHYPWAKDDVIREQLTFEHGMMRVPKGPGLGVTLDEDALARLAENRVRIGRDRRNDAAEAKKFFPEWEPKSPRW